MRHWLLLTIAMWTAPALADVVNPEEEACEGRRTGDACDADGRSGHCETGQCCRNRYNGGDDRPIRECSACLVCRQGPPGTPPPADGKESGCASAPGSPGPVGGLAVLIGLGLAVGLGKARRRAGADGAKSAPQKEN